MGYRFIKQYYEMKQNDTFENNNNRGNKSKTIRRGFFMKYFLNFLLVINGIFGSVSAQQYPVRLVPVVFPPYNVRLSDYALNSDPKLQLQVLMTDLLEPPHKTGIKFSLESGGRVIAVSSPFINGLDPFMLQPGSPISLSNLDLKPLFKLENLSGISPANYAKALPDGLYQYCFQAYDFYTKNNLSQKSCASVYQVLYEPPFLNLPQKGEKVTKKAEFQGVVFNWSPRQVAPNTKYIFTLKEIWDKQRDPVSAFLAARVLWKEESFAPSLYYGVDKTQLIPGRRYAWQVQAVSGTPQYNHSPIQEGGVYKNNGLSEIFFFDYVENCPVPAFLMAKTTARGRAEIQWMLQGASSKQFRVEYRKKGSSSPWLSETSYQTSAILSGLENNTEYEYRVGAVCGENKSFDPNDLSQADAFAYSGVQYFTTNFSNQNKNSAQCGVMPHVDLANKKPYDRQLTPNEVFTAGDFPVTVITAQGTAGNYTGEGFIQVPYLADTKIKVKFNNIQLNSDKQLINGTVETEYDANESAVHYASAGLGEIFGDKGIKDIKINYKIEKITLVMTPAPGVLRIVGIDPNGENKGPVQELPAGRDYTITDSSGKIWQVDEQGTVTEGEEIAKSGKSNADNTEGVKTSASGNISEITQYSANGVAIKWISVENSHFYFDTPDITKIPFDKYPQVKDTKGRNIVIPYKAVVKGQKEFIGARIIIEDPKLKEAKIEFKVLGSGKLINAELISNTGNQREYKLELKGIFSYGEEEIMAVLLPSENQQKTNKEDKKQKELKEAKQKIIGSFRLVHLEPKNVNLSLVPLDKASEAELDTIAKNIHNTYSRAGINFDIKKQPVLDISAVTTKDIDTPDDNPLSHYSKMQQSINRLYPAKINEYVLFITEKASSTGQKGFMPLGGQYGYAYKSKDKNTPAHELGHGVFRLEHPWSNKLIKTPQASTNLLMDYAGAAELSHFDWKQINDPKIKIYAFQKQTEGEDRNNDGIDLIGNIIIKVKQDTKDQKKIIGLLDSSKPYLRTGYDVFDIKDGKIQIHDKKTYYASIENGKVVYKTSEGNLFPYEIETSTSGRAQISLLADKCYYSTTYIDWKKPNYKTTNKIISLIEQKVKNSIWENQSLFIPDPSCDKYNIVDYIKTHKQNCNASEVNDELKLLKPILQKSNNFDVIIKNINNSCSATLGRLEYDLLIKNIISILNQKHSLKANVSEQSEIAILRLISAISYNDYSKFFEELKKDNEKLLKKLISEIDDHSIFFWEGNNHTGFMNLLLKMHHKLKNPYSQEPIKIIVRSDKFDTHYLKIENGKVKGQIQYALPKQGIERKEEFESEIFSEIDLIVIDKENYTLDLKRIPAFYVYYLLNKRNADAFNKYLSGYTNIYSIFVGLSNLAKLKDIPKAYRTIKATIAGIEIGTSATDLFLDYSDICNDNQEVCNNLRKLSFALNVTTLSADIYTSFEIQSLAQKTIESANRNNVTLPKEITEKIVNVNDKAVENTLEQLKKLGWATDDINLFNNTFKGTQTLENAKSWKLLRDRLDNPDASNALFRNAEAVNALTRLRNNPILRKLGLTDEIASKLKGAENLSFTQIIDNLENFARKTADNNVELKDFNKVLRQLTEGGGKSDGANWVITYITKHIGEFKGRKLVFEEFNSTTLGGRFIDVTDETIVRSKVFYEFKSVKTVPPKDFTEQFMKDLSNADNLSQIKWIFNGSKNPVDFRKNMLEAIDKLPLTENLAVKLIQEKNINKLRRYLKDNLEDIFLLK